mmetsp:Transcript_28357/g.43481  ORF Transcript_28357/g.43481 Transcript_28357/m.43481 type:complete len:205 (+) Transcript_28357:1589-2203(+)
MCRLSHLGKSVVKSFKSKPKTVFKYAVQCFRLKRERERTLTLGNFYVADDNIPSHYTFISSIAFRSNGHSLAISSSVLSTSIVAPVIVIIVVVVSTLLWSLTSSRIVILPTSTTTTRTTIVVIPSPWWGWWRGGTSISTTTTTTSTCIVFIPSSIFSWWWLTPCTIAISLKVSIAVVIFALSTTSATTASRGSQCLVQFIHHRF